MNKTKKKKVKFKQSGKRLLLLIIICVLVCSFSLFTICKCIFQIYEKYEEASILEVKYADLVEKEERLNEEVIKLQDSDYLARYVREKYFYSKDGEIIIRIPTDKE